MKKDKQQIMSPDLVRLVAARFKVLSEPLRIQILRVLESGEASVTSVTRSVNSTQPNISKHLRILQDEGLVSKRQEGNTVYYQIADKSVFKLCKLVCGGLEERFKGQSAIFR
jgi:DNA-binding transcriptional ArsR family regulator